MTLAFDLDETLCTGYPYEIAQPIAGVKELLLELRTAGHQIIIYTARGMGRSNGNIGKAQALIAKQTLDQLETWGFVYDEIYFGKPAADIYIDDKSISSLNALTQYLK